MTLQNEERFRDYYLDYYPKTVIFIYKSTSVDFAMHETSCSVEYTVTERCKEMKQDLDYSCLIKVSYLCT